jgi:anion-transporting  ArsA/GET3 family ATPase
VEVAPNFWARNIDAEKMARNFTETLNEATTAAFSKMVPGLDPELFSDMAGFPGMDEYFALEEILKLSQSCDYDIIVFDTAPTGHTLRALTAPDYIKTFLLKMLRMKAKIESFKGLLFKRDKSAETMVSILEEVCDKIDRLKTLLRSEFVNINLVSIASEAGLQECARTVKFLEAQKISVHNIIVNNIMPNFGPKVWEQAETNPATQLVKCEYDIQQPYLKSYQSLTESKNIRLVGVTRLPYEPRAGKLLDYAKLLWNPKKGVEFVPQKSLIYEDNSVIVNTPFITDAKWDISANNISYYFDQFNFGAGQYQYQVPFPAGCEGKPSKRLTKSGMKFAW